MKCSGLFLWPAINENNHRNLTELSTLCHSLYWKRSGIYYILYMFSLFIYLHNCTICIVYAGAMNIYIYIYGRNSNYAFHPFIIEVSFTLLTI